MEILDIFRKDIARKETIRGIMKAVRKSTYTWVFNAVKKLISEGILVYDIKGKSKLCSVSLNLKSIYYLSLLDYLEAGNAKQVLYDIVREIIDDMPSCYFSFIVTGSYAEGKQTKKSDLDVCVIIGDDSNKKRVSNYLNNKIMIPKLHAFVFTRSEFLQMLLDKEENYGKILYKKRLIYFGAENYYLIIKEAIEHGFRS